MSNAGHKIKQRYVDSNSYGFKCPVESQEGENCGSVLSLSIQCVISSNLDD
jgi:DNA-directed RNA polymerase beta subunit